MYSSLVVVSHQLPEKHSLLRPAFANAKGSVQSVSENLSRAFSSY